MADETIRTVIEFAMRGDKEVQKAVDLITKMADGAELSAKELSRLEKTVVAAGSTLKDLVAAVKAQDAAAKGNLQTIINQEKAYRSYAESIKVAAQAQRDLKANQDRAFGSYASNMPAQVKRAQESAYASYAPNVAFTKERERQQREFEKYKIASDARIADAERKFLNDSRRQAEAQARHRMGQIQAQAIQENKLFDQRRKRDEAQLAYAREAQRQGVKYGEQTVNSMITQRYALYDVAATWGIVSAATLGAAAAALKVGIDYERAFANVRRTTEVSGDAADELYDSLIDLTTAIPADFAEITGIATLGGQLNIAADGIDDFTRVVAMLTATTNLSTEAAGTALGRFKALLGVPERQFEALGSSILRVGVNSVATETQIVNIATQISSMGDFAGMTADQVVGLSGALASVGAQPELSRGTITRTFTQMSAAVGMGGTKLEEFARVAGVSAEEFRSAWGTEDFAEVFQKFLAGLDREGVNAVQTLNALGISSVRDVPLLLRLAGAGDVVSDAFRDAAQGFNEASDLQDHFGVVAETVAARLERLQNTLQGIIATVSDSTAIGPLNALLGIVQRLAEGFLALVRNPVGAWVVGVIAAFGALVGAVAAYRTMQALTLASMYAMQTAMQSMSITTTRNGHAVRSLVGLLTTQAVGTQRATAFQEAYNRALERGASRAAAFTAGVRAMSAANAANAASSTAASAGVTQLATAGRGASLAMGLVGGGLGAVLLAMIPIYEIYSRNKQQAVQWTNALAASLDAETGAATRATEAQIRRRFQDEQLNAARQALGLTMNTIVQAALGEEEALRKVNSVTQEAIELNDEAARGNIAFADGMIERADAAARIERALGAEAEMLALAKEEWEAYTGGQQEATEATEDYLQVLQQVFDTHFGAIDSTRAVQDAMRGLGEALYENGTAFDVYTAAGSANMQALSGVINAMITASAGDAQALAVMLAGLMDQLASYGVDAVNELAFVANMIAELTRGRGVAGMAGLTRATQEASHALGTGYAAAAHRAAQANTKKAKSARDAAKEIRTLSDYVKDLTGVFRDAFEFRFGLDRSIDGVAEAYQKLVNYSLDAAEAVRDAQQAIRDADAEIRGLQAARGTLEYQLRVAQEYGDTLRANEILAELAKNEEELRKKQRDRSKSQRELTKAQDASRKSLDGQTEGSREQREIVLDLLGAYQDQVSALANTGLSQDQLRRRTEQLRQQFVAQLRQLGYNEREVQRYAKSFDDLTYAINNVPRNITVDADTDPAIRALNEFLARANNSRASIKMDAAGGGTFRPSSIAVGNGGVTTPALNVSQTVTRDLHIRELLSTPRWQERYPHTPIPRAKGGPVPEYHATGGVHGLHPGKPMGTDTTPAWLTPGEYVHQKKAVQYYGLPFMNALNNMQIPRYLATGSGSAPRGGNTGIAVVELSATDRALLAAAGNVTLTVDGKVLARTVNKNNANNAARGGN